MSFRGIAADNDARFTNAEKKLLQNTKFPAIFQKKVDMDKVNLQVIRPWTQQKIITLLGFEDEVVIELVFSLLEAGRFPDPRKAQLSLTGFLGKQTPALMTELWELLISAQDAVGGVPPVLLEQKKVELAQRRQDQASTVKVEPIAQQTFDDFERPQRMRQAEPMQGGRLDARRDQREEFRRHGSQSYNRSTDHRNGRDQNRSRASHYDRREIDDRDRSNRRQSAQPWRRSDDNASRDIHYSSRNRDESSRRTRRQKSRSRSRSRSRSKVRGRSASSERRKHSPVRRASRRSISPDSRARPSHRRSRSSSRSRSRSSSRSTSRSTRTRSYSRSTSRSHSNSRSPSRSPKIARSRARDEDRDRDRSASGKSPSDRRRRRSRSRSRSRHRRHRSRSRDYRRRSRSRERRRRRSRSRSDSPELSDDRGKRRRGRSTTPPPAASDSKVAHRAVKEESADLASEREKKQREVELRAKLMRQKLLAQRES